MVFDWEFIHPLLFIFDKLWGLILLVPTCCSCSVVKTYLTLWTLWTVACQAPLYFTISWSLLNSMSVESVIPSNHLIFYCLLLLLPSIFTSIFFFFFPVRQLFSSGGQGIGVSASASVLPVNTQDWSPLGLIGLIPCSQLSSPAPQLESISSSVVSLLYGPALTSLHDYWKNHSFDQMDLGQQSDVSVF